MTKNIVICCDGTWNTPDELDGGVPAPTNVVRLFNSVAATDAAGVAQRKYYHPGVGTDGSWWDKLAGGGTGRGLDRNIMSAYRELSDNYEQGDRIHLFGFSRGAYTVRSLAGMISRCGLLDTRTLDESGDWAWIERVFQQGYRRRTETRKDWERLGYRFHNAPGEAVPIRFVGVWDTVGALGIPNDLAILNLLDGLHDHAFHDTALGASIEFARHAVALDEMRASFQPTLWSAEAEAASDNPPRLLQVWFPGVHSNVGGGYREAGLSDGALQWMIEEAGKCAPQGESGLAFMTEMTRQIRPDYQDFLHDSCTGPFSILPTQPRSAPRFLRDKAELSPSIHPSAFERQLAPPIHQCPYRPQRLHEETTPLAVEVFATLPWNDTGLWLEAGVKYRFEATGEWIDGSIKCGPGGSDDGRFQAAELAQVAGSLLGRFEGLFRKLTGNQAADFRFTRRHEEMPWFCLVGAISNGGGVDAKGNLAPHESFRIGQGCEYTPGRAGYFFAYANDAWNCYGNNRGRVRLSIVSIHTRHG